ncbi:tetratricopeptide repeat protein [Candidatus Woesearchaeota archaeon]|nr:tetratricopeptide repeat protein [Candidatus Woesearchaeota archaeon]
MKKLDHLLRGFGFLATANGKATVVSSDLSSEHLRVLAEVGLADCFYDPTHSEAVLVRRRRKSFPYGLHVVSEEEAFSTKREGEISRLEEYAGRFPRRFLSVERHDLQHFQALSKVLPPDKLVKYLEAEAESEVVEEKQGLMGLFLKRIGIRKDKPVSSRYVGLIDAVARIEGSEPDVATLRRTKDRMLIFTGTLGGEPTYPLRGITGPLAFEEALNRGVTVQILFGPYVCVGRTMDQKFEDYFGEVFPLGNGNSVRLELTSGDTHRSNGTAYVNPNQVEESAQLLYRLAEEGDTISPILSDPARIMLGRAFEQSHNPEYLMALNRVLMYRGRYAHAAQALEMVRDVFEEVESPLARSEFFVYLGDAYFRLGELDKAAEVVWEAIKARPENHVAHLLLGSVNQVRGNYEDSQRDLERSLELAPNVEITKQFLDRTQRVQQLM